jgi:glycerol-3-phosphate dehydrogenase (NAD(P)+)
MSGGGEGRPETVGVLGGGSWGTALAALLAKKGHRTVLWAREPEVVDSILGKHENTLFLPGIELPPSLSATSDLEVAVDGADTMVLVTPVQYSAGILELVAPHLSDGTRIVTASKGLELSTLRRMDEVIEDVLGEAVHDRLSVLSGPSFAAEVAREAPTAVVAASHSHETRLATQALFRTEYFRPYTTDDVIGVEIGGALKNVIALATGIAAGVGFGHNTRAALITRGLAEIRRLGVAVGARAETFAGLAGMGDLVLTCTGDLSRNRSAGIRIGKGEPMESILSEGGAVAEGIPTAEAAYRLAEKIGVEMPICSEIHAILYGGSSARGALKNLMSRDPKPEEWG